MNFLLTTKCNSNCKFCFVPKEVKKEQQEMSFLQFKNYLDHINKLYKKNKPIVGILGGEPTLAKDFPMIIGYAKSYTGGIRLYSSLITDTKNIEYMLGAKNIALSWNVSAYKQASVANKKLILKNLRLIKKDFKNNVLASITLYPNFQIKDFYETIKILQKYNIDNIRIALDSTNYLAFINYGTKIFEFIKYLKKQKFNLYSSSCGHFIKNIFTKEQEEYLRQNVHNFKYNDCSKNYPLDVLPNGTVVPCVSFSNRNKNINFLKYNNLNKLKQKITKEYNLVEQQTDYCMANNKFKIIIGFNPSDTIEFLKQNNIKEVYCGYYDKESEKKWPVAFTTMNRRGEGVNFGSFNKLKTKTKEIYKNNINVYITLNGYYTKEQYSWLKKSINNIKKEESISGIIINDIGLLLLLKKMKFNKNITISTLATAFNSNAINFYKKFGANRIVLDRQLTPKEIVELANIHKDMEFEIFVLSTGGCLFVDGHCSFFHCLEGLKNKTKKNKSLYEAKLYDLTTSGAGCCTILNNFGSEDFNIVSNNKHKFEISKTLGFSCNICMLYKLRNLKNISLKIDSRGSNGSGVTNINMLNELIAAVNSSVNSNEYIKKAREILYKHKKVKCNPKLCLYCKDN